MNSYDPSVAPIPEEWLALPEEERIELIRSYHEENEENLSEEDQLELHAGVHAVVENQVAMAYEPVPQTLAKLMRQGLSRHDAVHAIAAVLAEEIWHSQQHEQSKWESGVYRRKLEKLTAKRWRKGQY